MSRRARNRNLAAGPVVVQAVRKKVGDDDIHAVRSQEYLRGRELTPDNYPFVVGQRLQPIDAPRGDVREMRARMRRELSKAGAGQFDIKQDSGGIADIEFLVQYWVLANAHARPDLLTFSDNIRQLEGLATEGILERPTALWLEETYIGYRTILHRLSLEGGERVVDAAQHAATRARVEAIWSSTFGS